MQVARSLTQVVFPPSCISARLRKTLGPSAVRTQAVTTLDLWPSMGLSPNQRESLRGGSGEITCGARVVQKGPEEHPLVERDRHRDRAQRPRRRFSGPARAGFLGSAGQAGLLSELENPGRLAPGVHLLLSAPVPSFCSPEQIFLDARPHVKRPFIKRTAFDEATSLLEVESEEVHPGTDSGTRTDQEVICLRGSVGLRNISKWGAAGRCRVWLGWGGVT
ncbi:uncharacterized protein LOC125085509 isoform X2 [Lutra lutra]|uniref:uncharacterized protein LOC125085509 isoform X2 n=1 Tax=Lutra lutra TaxID=9657 RepID=UPI001FCFC83D|nr:uncharacterized protein LOC125085509 isoform X2 [Lutra lutra]